MDIIKVKKPDKKTLLQVLSAVENSFYKEVNNSFTKPDFLYFKKKIINKFSLNPQCTLYVAREKKMVKGLAFFRLLHWDSQIFGFKIGRMENLILNMEGYYKENFLNTIIRDCIKDKYRHVHCRIGLRELGILRLLENFKFNVVDIQCTLSTPENFKSLNLKATNKFLIRKAKGQDLSSLRETLKGAFLDTRFSVDHNYPRDKVDKLYFGWVKNAMLDPKERVFVAYDKKNRNLFGFMICNFDQESKESLGLRIGYIDLIAVNRGFRNIGIGKQLIRFALKWFASRADRVEIRTQVSNIAAIKCFTGSGLSEFSYGTALPAGISLHRWF